MRLPTCPDQQINCGQSTCHQILLDRLGCNFFRFNATGNNFSNSFKHFIIATICQKEIQFVLVVMGGFLNSLNYNLFQRRRKLLLPFSNHIYSYAVTVNIFIDDQFFEILLINFQKFLLFSKWSLLEILQRRSPKRKAVNPIIISPTSQLFQLFCASLVTHPWVKPYILCPPSVPIRNNGNMTRKVYIFYFIVL